MNSIFSKQSLASLLIPILLTISFSSFPIQTLARNPHIIDFRSLNLYPEGLAWDPSAQHFLVGSLRNRTISSISDAGVVEILIFDSTLPENVTFLGLAVDTIHQRLLAVIHAAEPLPHFNALAAYDLRSRRRIFLSHLPSGDDVGDSRQIANDVAVDFKGNAFVTNAAGNFIWRVNAQGEASIFSKSRMYTAHPVIPNTVYSFCGLNGVAYVSKGYLLVVQSNTGKMYKVDADDGTARLVLLSEDLKGADDVAVRGDGVVLVVSYNKLWFLNSHDSWGEGVVYDKIDLDEEKFPTSVVVGGEGRTYVLYGHLMEGIKGKEGGRERFSIKEVRSPEESGEEKIWIYILIGFGLAYFLFWRFQMGRLVNNMDKKIN